MSSQISLRHLLAQKMTIVAVIPLVITGILIFFYLFPIVKSNISIQHHSLASAVSGQILSYLQGGERQLTSIAEVIAKNRDLTDDQITAILDSACGKGKLFESIFIADKQSKIISHVGFPEIKQIRRTEITGLDVSGRNIHEENLKNTTHWSKTFLSTLSSRMAVAVTISLPNRLIVGEITLDNLSEFIKHNPDETELRTLIMDQTGRVVADSDLVSMGRQFELKTLPKIQKKNELSYQIYHLNDKKLVGVMVKIDQVNWNVLVSQPYAKAFHQTNTVLWIICAGLIFALISALFLSLRQGNRLSQLIIFYIDQAKKIAHGNYDLHWPDAKTFEYNELAKTLRAMAEQIGEREEKLIASENHLSITLNSIGDAVITTNAAGLITRMNPVASKLTGWTLEDALGKPLSEVMKLRIEDKESEIFDPAQEVLKTQKVITLPPNTFLEAKNGEFYRVADSGAPICGDDSNNIGVVIVFRDTTDEHVLQEQLHHSRKMDAIGQLAGGVAHDFNNMLSGIYGASELLELSLSGKERELKHLNLIKKAVERASDLTGQLLAFSRKGKQLSTAVDFHTILQETVALLERSIDKRISIQMDLDAQQYMVVGDPSQLQSGILNLCINARDAMPKGGSLYFSTTVVMFSEDDDIINNSDLTPDKYLKLSIKDTGCGIPPEFQSRVFEPFFTTKETGKGTGLGLAAVYGMIKEHHGHIHLHSELGKGTVFYIYLPLSEKALPITPKTNDHIVYGSGTILVVDDEELIRATASLLLENLGYTVLLAENGQEAVDIYKKKIDIIDLVILDMVMPVLDGRETFEKITEINPDAKVIISSGYTKNISVANMMNQGLSGAISKPGNQLELSQLVADVITK